MLIKIRPVNLSNIERSKEKTTLILQWLLNYRISSIEILAAVIGLAPNGASRFFKKLIKEKLIEPIMPINYPRRGLVILGTRAAAYLEDDTRDFTADILKGRRMATKEGIHHSLQIQKAVLKHLPSAMEVVSEFDLQISGKRPDALVFKEKATFAIELEHTIKFKKTVHLIFQQYIDMIESRQVDVVIFYFSVVKHREDYERYFKEEDWNEAKIDKKKKTTKLTGSMIHIPQDHWIRKRVLFRDLPPREPAKIFKMEEACKPKPSFTMSYKERLEEGEFQNRAEKARKKREIYAEIEEKKRLEEEAGYERKRKNEEQLRLERNQKIKDLQHQLAESKKADSKPSSWLPGYVSKTQEIQNELNKWLDCLIAQ